MPLAGPAPEVVLTSDGERSKWRGHALLAGACVLPVLAAAGVFFYARRTLEMRYPGGSDPTLWGLEAMNHTVGAPGSVTPLYPMVLSWFVGWTGEPVTPGGWLSALSWLLAAPVVVLLARRLGARTWMAAVAGLLYVVAPYPLLFANQAQPDALNTLLLALAALAAVHHLARPGVASSVAVALLAGLAPLVREHGVMVAGLLVGVAAWAPGTLRARLLRGAGVVGAVLLAPALAGHGVALPWSTPWFERVFDTLRETGRDGRPGFMGQLQPEESRRVAELLDSGAVFGLQRFYLWHALAGAPAVWAWILAGWIGTIWGRGRARWGGAVALLPVLAALVIYSQPRHVAIALPVAAAAWIASADRGGWLRRGGMLAVAVGVSVWGAQQVPRLRALLEGQARGVEALAEFGSALCGHVEPNALGAGASGPFLFCPLPVHKPKRERSAADWLTWWVQFPPRTPGWGEVDVGSDMFVVYRFVPQLEGEDRPCRDARYPDEGLAYRTNHPVPVRMVSSCDPEPENLEALVAEVPVPNDEVGARRAEGPDPNKRPMGQKRPLPNTKKEKGPPPPGGPPIHKPPPEGDPPRPAPGGGSG